MANTEPLWRWTPTQQFEEVIPAERRSQGIRPVPDPSLETAGSVTKLRQVVRTIGVYDVAGSVMTWTRRREPEWMDDPTLDAALHRQALAGLRRINSWSRSGAAIWQAISNLAVQRQLPEIRILDLAMGGGDVAMRLAQCAARDNLRVMITGCDISPVAVAEAQQRARAAGVENVEFRPMNVLRDELPSHYDVVMCSLFLHHLDESDAVVLLKKMRDAAQRLVLIDDLRRTWRGYWLAWLGCRVLSRSPVVHKDGPLSVAGAFTSTEACNLAQRAGLLGATITDHWPQRFLLRWSRP